MKSKIKKIIGILFVIFWMFVIFWFSSMDGEESNSKSKGTLNKTLTEAATITNRLKITDVNTESNKKYGLIDILNKYMRKGMHVSIYFVLSIFIYAACRMCNIGKIKSFFLAIILCFIYACTDEYHQTFVGGRSGEFRDVLIDTAGAFIGATISLIIAYLKSYIKSKRVSKNKAKEI